MYLEPETFPALQPVDGFGQWQMKGGIALVFHAARLFGGKLHLDIQMGADKNQFVAFENALVVPLIRALLQPQPFVVDSQQGG